MKTAIIHLTWKRPHRYKEFLDMLDCQTVLDFDLFVSNANPEISETINRLNQTERKYRVHTVESFQETHPFRRFDLAKSLDYERYIFIDDDVIIPSNFIEECCKQYEPESYKSWWAWTFNSNSDYWDRERVLSRGAAVHYGGAGVSVVDGALFKKKELFDKTTDGSKIYDDLWISYVLDSLLGWKIEYLDIGGISFSTDSEDENSLYRIGLQSDYTKNDFYVDLVESGWTLKHQ